MFSGCETYEKQLGIEKTRLSHQVWSHGGSTFKKNMTLNGHFPALQKLTHMCLQVACPNRGIVTLAAFVRFFPTVKFQMCSQIASLSRCIVTLVAFVYFFSSVSCEMSPQMTYINRRILTEATFV